MLDKITSKLKHKFPNLLAHLGATACTLIIITALAKFNRYEGSGTYSASKGELSEHSSLDDLAKNYFEKTSDVKNAPDCIPLRMYRSKGVDIYYLYCSDRAQLSNAQPVKLTQNFEVTPALARRYHFWRRVYTLWSGDQYVLHVADFPEISLEIADTSSLGRNISEYQKQKIANRILSTRREQYRALFRRMHALRNRPKDFSPAMQRIAEQMTHIESPNKYLQASLSLRVQKGQREQIAAGIARASRYMSAIDIAFAQEGLPPELSRIAFLESSFNLKAYSKVGASGVYQIMPLTGRQYNLIINDDIDERRDPVKSAHAAARILSDNYQSTKAWPLAITSYNHGINGIKRAVRVVGSNNIEDLIAKYEGAAFGFASKNFYTGFLAILSSLNDAANVFPEIIRVQPLRFSEFRLTSPIRTSQAMEQYRISSNDLMDFNPDLSPHLLYRNDYLPKGYVLKVPAVETASEKGIINVIWQE